MSASGPIGRTPRQVAGPGVDDPDPAPEVSASGDPREESVAGAEPAPGRSVFDTSPEGEEVVDPDGRAASDPEVVEPEVVEPEVVEPEVVEPEVVAAAPPPDPDDRVVLPEDPDLEDEAPPTVETVPAPDPERDIDEDPVFLDDHTTEVADAPVPTPGDGAHVAPTAGADAPDAGGFMGDTEDLRTRWEDVQASFVDDPRQAVVHADEMVSVAVAALQARVEQRREDLAETWRTGEQPSTDDLLVAFQRYRDLFDGVLST